MYLARSLNTGRLLLLVFLALLHGQQWNHDLQTLNMAFLQIQTGIMGGDIWPWTGRDSNINVSPGDQELFVKYIVFLWLTKSSSVTASVRCDLPHIGYEHFTVCSGMSPQLQVLNLRDGCNEMTLSSPVFVIVQRCCSFRRSNGMLVLST